MSRIALNELETFLWESANFLRSNIDASEYKQYIFPLLFYKRLSDVYDEETNKAKEKYGDDFDFFNDETLHSFNIPDGYHWNDVRNTPENVGEAIVKAFHAIENANSPKLLGVFGDGAWTNKNKLPDYLLKDLMEHFSGLTLSIENCPEDELGTGYEYLIRKFADDSGHTAQEFYTNRTVVHLMTELLKPQSGESVYDPTCGTAGMLISCISYLKQQGKEWRNLKLYGQEITTLTSSIGRINCILHGVNDFEIVNGDTLAAPAFTDGGKLKTFSICLANPPYSIKTWNRNAFETDLYGRNFLGTPPQGRADYAFIQHIIKSLDKDNGRCAILLPNGILFREEEKDIRRKMIEADLVDCVIGLAPNLFFNSPMEACVLICRTKKEASKRGKMLVINAISEVKRKNAESYLEDTHINKIKEAYEGYIDVDGFAKVITIKEAADKDFSLNVPFYIPNKIDDSEQIGSFEENVKLWIESINDLDLNLSNLVKMLEINENE